MGGGGAGFVGNDADPVGFQGIHFDGDGDGGMESCER